jgi:hypothetical protein
MLFAAIAPLMATTITITGTLIVDHSPGEPAYPQASISGFDFAASGNGVPAITGYLIYIGTAFLSGHITNLFSVLLSPSAGTSWNGHAHLEGIFFSPPAEFDLFAPSSEYSVQFPFGSPLYKRETWTFKATSSDVPEPAIAMLNTAGFAVLVCLRAIVGRARCGR